MAVDVKIPSLGESVSQGVISRWLKKDGDQVETDEVLFELETDKATMEIPAEAAGRLEILKQEGAEVSVGTVVARISADGAGAKAKPAGKPAEAPREEPAAAPAKEAAARPAPEKKPEKQPEKPEPKREAAGEEPPLGPAVRRLIAEHDLDPSKITPSGRGGRLTKEDVLAHLGKAEAPEAKEAPPSKPAPAAEPEPAAEEA
ncbi:MAG: biotin/lipoyl-containing protein, partial [Candidatus Binatia bacterium]